MQIKCMGRGSYQRTRLDKYGFPRGHLTRQKQMKGFQTGDLIKAVVTSGKKWVLTLVEWQFALAAALMLR